MVPRGNDCRLLRSMPTLHAEALQELPVDQEVCCQLQIDLQIDITGFGNIFQQKGTPFLASPQASSGR